MNEWINATTTIYNTADVATTTTTTTTINSSTGIIIISTFTSSSTSTITTITPSNKKYNLRYCFNSTFRLQVSNLRLFTSLASCNVFLAATNAEDCRICFCLELAWGWESSECCALMTPFRPRVVACWCFWVRARITRPCKMSFQAITLLSHLWSQKCVSHYRKVHVWDMCPISSHLTFYIGICT